MNQQPYQPQNEFSFVVAETTTTIVNWFMRTIMNGVCIRVCVLGFVCVQLFNSEWRARIKNHFIIIEQIRI